MKTRRKEKKNCKQFDEKCDIDGEIKKKLGTGGGRNRKRREKRRKLVDENGDDNFDRE